MPIDDEALLRFDSTTYANYTESRARERLRGEDADLYRGQLIAAHLMDLWRERTLAHDMTVGSSTFSADYGVGWERAMREMIASLRQGDFAPGGGAYEDNIGRR